MIGSGLPKRRAPIESGPITSLVPVRKIVKKIYCWLVAVTCSIFVPVNTQGGGSFTTFVFLFLCYRCLALVVRRHLLIRHLIIACCSCSKNRGWILIVERATNHNGDYF